MHVMQTHLMKSGGSLLLGLLLIFPPPLGAGLAPSSALDLQEWDFCYLLMQAHFMPL